jgi:hypothetical protein
MKEVFCKNCKFLYFNIMDGVNCTKNSTNKIIKIIDYVFGHQYVKDIKYIRYGDNNFPNKKGTCKYYKKLWYKFWI